MISKKIIDKAILEEWSKKRSIEDFEKEFCIFTPVEMRKQKRFGYPKSKYYCKMLTKKELIKNRNIVNKFLSIDE